LILSVMLKDPPDPVIVVENLSNSVAEGVGWELVMFRVSDQAFFSYVHQSIGYIKAHSKSAPHALQLNTLAHAPGSGEIPGGGQLVAGDDLIGTLAVDCPLCRGTTLIVHFVWGSSGWFSELPDGNGRLYLPKGMTRESVTQFITIVDGLSKLAQRVNIQ
jgi:hypothetical protein